ncbi:metal-dependent hydrolase [Natranaeroarchaeum sulfidigenes]|uniref:Putative membrane-bound metal-dependent hydrolase n=1 Tax=Natranaeroarchaeum sulfidigenes TaxID=2784880 RepID=A0A897MMB7_9EURY|nr:metal-dependent hydrolase [Natranaeroarchaeum sulfidigenes]QSG03340.1 putative membrane-bound metal-dependent hydrolase [Natranaeroarchaeum sulfidigenes]
MMATTHGFVGLAIAAAVAVIAPELAVAAAIGGIAGGIFPDLDVLAEHRRTLHFPGYYTMVALPALGLAYVVTDVVTVGVATFLVAAAVHSLSDALGGTPSAAPWKSDLDHGVYFHAADRWLPAKRWIRYDGAPEDFALGAVFALPGLVVFDGSIRYLALTGIAVSLVYTVFRRPIGNAVAGLE